MAMGDDCVETFVPEAVEKYAALGHTMKFYETKNDALEFCSHVFKKSERPYPVNWDKTLFRLLSQPDSLQNRETFVQFITEMRNLPQATEILEEIIKYEHWTTPKKPHIVEQSKAGRLIGSCQNKPRMVSHAKTTKAPKPTLKREKNISLNMVRPIKNSHPNEHLRRGPLTAHKGPRAPVAVGFKTPGASYSSRRIGHKEYVKGTCIAYSLTPCTGQTGSTESRMALVLPVTPYSMGDPRLAFLAASYQRYKIKSMRARYLPQIASTQGGGVMMAFQTYLEVPPSYSSIDLRRYLGALEGVKESNAWTSFSVTLPKAEYLPSYICSTTDTDVTNAVQAMFLVSCQGVVNSIVLGDLEFDYEIEFSNPISPLARLPTTNFNLVLAAAVPAGSSLTTYQASSVIPNGIYVATLLNDLQVGGILTAVNTASGTLQAGNTVIVDVSNATAQYAATSIIFIYESLAAQQSSEPIKLSVGATTVPSNYAIKLFASRVTQLSSYGTLGPIAVPDPRMVDLYDDVNVNNVSIDAVNPKPTLSVSDRRLNLPQEYQELYPHSAQRR